MSANGTLYFQSLDRSDGYGAADIYRAKNVKGLYPKVENLGEKINSAYGDGEALIARDESYLIFCSYRPGHGESDIYISFNHGGSWTDPIDVGPKINTEQAKYGTALSTDGKFLFFTRRKAWQTNTDSDIWWVSADFIEILRGKCDGRKNK